MKVKGFSDLIDDLNRASTIKNIEKICEDFLVLLNIDHFLFIVVEKTSLYSPVIALHSNFPEEFTKEIKGNALCRNFFITKLLDKHAPEKWCASNSQSLDSDDLSAFMADYGFSSGINVPIKSAHGELVFFSMASKKTVEPAHLDSVLLFAHTFAAHLFDSYVSIKRKIENNKRLTQREIDCLFWACEGKTAWEIAQIMGLSQRTVTFHLKNSAHKLSAKNRQHAVALAVMKGIVKPNLARLKSIDLFGEFINNNRRAMKTV